MFFLNKYFSIKKKETNFNIDLKQRRDNFMYNKTHHFARAISKRQHFTAAKNFFPARHKTLAGSIIIYIRIHAAISKIALESPLNFAH